MDDLLAALASSQPTPAGGSAAAMAAAMGTALLRKLARLAQSRATSLDASFKRLEVLQQRLAHAVDDDAHAYEEVVAATKRARHAGLREPIHAAPVQEKLRLATDAPLTVMRLSTEAITQAPLIAAHTTSVTSGDVAVAIVLIQAGLRGSGISVGVNLQEITDQTYVTDVRREMTALKHEADMAAAAAAAACKWVEP